MSAERAVLFIDGSNFYHAARGVGVAAGNLDYRTLARRLILDRELTGIRYYAGRVQGMYDVAYLLSADSDLVPAVEVVRSRGKKVFAASPAFGHELEKVVDAFISLRRGWFSGLSL